MDLNHRSMGRRGREKTVRVLADTFFCWGRIQRQLLLMIIIIFHKMTGGTIRLLFFFFSVCLGCDSLYQLSYSGKGCVMAVYPDDTNGTTCDQFNLLQCRYDECVTHFIFCFNWERRISKQWSECSSKCCPQDNVYNQSVNGIKMCQEHLWQAEDDRRFFVVMAMCIVLFVIVYCKEVQKSRRNRSQSEQAQPPAAQQHQLQEHQNIQDAHQWHKCDSYDKSSVCGVCLEGQTNLKLKCGHFYHQTCIVQWLKQKKDCPLCKKAVTDKATVYCHRCHFYSQNIKMLNSLPSVPRECPNCFDPAGEKMFN